MFSLIEIFKKKLERTSEKILNLYKQKLKLVDWLTKPN